MNDKRGNERYANIKKRYTDFFGAEAWPMFGEFPQFESLDELDEAVSVAILTKTEIEQEYKGIMIL